MPFDSACVPPCMLLHGILFSKHAAVCCRFPDQLYDGKYGVGLDTASLVYTDGSFNPTGRAFQAL